MVPPNLRHNAFYCWAWKKVHYYNEDCIIGVSGATGVGKTTLSVRLAELLDIDHHGVSRFPTKGDFKGKIVDCPRLVNSIEDYKELRKKTNYPVGSAFVIDEAQTLINSRDFMSRKNKDVIRLVSTGRVFRAFTFLNLPYWEHLDNQVKSYLHAVLIVSRPDRGRKISIWTPYRVFPQGYGKPPWLKKFRRIDPLTGRSYHLDECESRLPSKLLNEAQQRKTNLWKALVHEGKIAPDGSLWSDKPVLEQKKRPSKEELLQKSKQLFEDLKEIHERFRLNNRYSAAKIRAHTGESRVLCDMVALRLLDWYETQRSLDKL